MPLVRNEENELRHNATKSGRDNHRSGKQATDQSQFTSPGTDKCKIGEHADGQRYTKGEEYSHRSHSPNTTSIAPMIAVVSASMWPFDIMSIACKWLNAVGRILQRYGLLVPSLTR